MQFNILLSSAKLKSSATRFIYYLLLLTGTMNRDIQKWLLVFQCLEEGYWSFNASGEGLHTKGEQRTLGLSLAKIRNVSKGGSWRFTRTKLEPTHSNISHTCGKDDVLILFHFLYPLKKTLMWNETEAAKPFLVDWCSNSPQKLDRAWMRSQPLLLLLLA